MIERKLLQGSKEWKEWRKGRIGSSDVAAIMGVSPYETPYQLWRRMVEGKEVEENEAMRRGKELEPFARSIYNDIYEMECIPKVLIDDELPYFHASVDGIDESIDNVIEIKTGGRRLQEMIDQMKIPDHHMIQCQAILAITGYDKMTYVYYDGENITPIEIQASKQKIKSIKKEVATFWNEYLLKLVAPPLMEKDYRVRDDDAWKEKAVAYQDVYRLADIYSKEKEKIKKELIEMAEGFSTIGGGIKLTSYGRPGSIQAAKLKEAGLNPDDFRGSPSTSYKITEIKEIIS